ncbi:MAG TPA: SpoIID/LytB domain-containing protein [Gaiellaceae bacterium]|nr:SpoIID/LytB domain-containing protein [Gaiellaceae bacterium]
MHRAFIAVVLAVLGFAPSAFATPVFFVTGHGWGHGIGMPQYGAYGFAQHGWTYKQILEHYYPGTQAAQTPISSVRILLDSGRPSIGFGSTAPFTVEDGAGRSWTLPAGTRSLGTGLKLKIDGKVEKLTSPVRVISGAGFVAVGGREYRGSLTIILAGGSLSVVNNVGLESYLAGVVPWEMPARWSPAALRVQAVAARSYALASRKPTGSYDLFDDTRSQVYGGVVAEDPRTNAAISDTAGEIRAYNGAVAWTFFHSTSGGRTAAVQDVWAGAAPKPYLASVPDPYDSISPYHNWGPFRYSRAALDAELGSSVAGRLLDLKTTVNGSRRVGEVLATGSTGATSISASAFQVALGLRSTWFRIGVMNLKTAERQVAFGHRTKLSGLARGVGKVWLERKREGGQWTRVRNLKPAADGTFATRVRPRVATAYRIGSKRGTGAPVRVLVAAKVNFYLVTDPSRLTGVVRPLLPRATVVIQRRSGTNWRAVARGRTTAGGEFSISVSVRPGVYRGVATLGSWSTVGRTPLLHVVSE